MIRAPNGTLGGRRNIKADADEVPCAPLGTKNDLTSPIDEETFGNQSILDFLNVQTVSESLMSITLLLHFHRPRAQQMDHSERLS